MITKGYWDMLVEDTLEEVWNFRDDNKGCRDMPVEDTWEEIWNFRDDN